jgi:plasmid stabilization system protein ParE
VSGYRLTPSAENDLFEIWCFIAQDSTDAANRVEEAIYDACRLLARSPRAGQERPDLTRRALRFWTVSPFKKYVVIYDPDTRPLRILRILHSARNIRVLLKDLQ